MRMIPTTLFITMALALGACKREAPAAAKAGAPPGDAHASHGAEPATIPKPATEPSASAELKPTQGNTVSGIVTFKVIDGVLRVIGEVSGLKPNSEHGFHIHEKGDCSAPDGSSAGGHFNPAHSEHGNVSTNPHHGGDMPNIVADAQGNATVDAVISSNVNLGKGDAFDITGRAVIVHADPDDYKSQPTGNAGGRLACGVITANP